MVKKLLSLCAVIVMMISAAVLLPGSFGSAIKASAKTVYYDKFTLNINEKKWKNITSSVSGVNTAYSYIGDTTNQYYVTANFNVIVQNDAGKYKLSDYIEDAKRQYKNAGYDVKSCKSVKFNGYDAYKIATSFNNSGYTMATNQFILMQNDSLYIITYGSESSVANKLQSEFDEVLSTFKVLKRKSIANAKVTLKNKYYTGKEIKQSPVVKLGKKTLKEGTDYTVSYKNNKKIGKATVTVSGIKKYKGSVKATFKINPKKTSPEKVTSPKTKQLKAVYSQVKGVTGYQIKYSTSSKFTKDTTKTVTVKGADSTSKTISKLTKGKTYYVKVRTYKTVGKTKYYSGYSAVEKVKVK